MEASEVYIRASSKGRPSTIREVKASYIGQLVRISGIVTRCSDVKPLMQVAVYTCEECGFEIYQVLLCLTVILESRYPWLHLINYNFNLYTINRKLLLRYLCLYLCAHPNAAIQIKQKGTLFSNSEHQNFWSFRRLIFILI